MRYQTLFLASSLLLLSACQSPDVADSVLPSGIELIEQRQVNNEEQGIAYQKYQLANGLTLVLHQDHSDPLVHVDMTYHVGSARETLGKSGFAHFFEHMMFQGSEHVADEQHFKIVTEAGGNLNGTTNSDRTNYYQTVPANQLEKMLWLEADRMGFLLNAVTQEKFEVQRATVKNERAENYDNQPYGLRGEKTAQALYPPSHPYSWPTIGYVEDLDRVKVDDLKAFFKTWYGPNNATLTIGGDIDIAQTLQWVNKYFGVIPAGPEVPELVKSPVSLQQDRYITLEDQVHLPLLQITYPTVYARHEDEAPLDVLSQILGEGKTSLFYKNMIKGGFAVNAGVSHPCRELACEFQLIALPHPGRIQNLKQLQDIVDATLLEFEQRGVSEEDLQRTKVAIEASTIFGLQSVAGKVSTLAANQTFAGEPDMVAYDLNRYASVTAEDVMRVYRRYIKDKAAVVLSIVPQGNIAMAAGEQNFSFQRPALPSIAHSDKVTAPEISEDFDRSIMPGSGPNPAVTVPDFSREDFANGLTLVAHHSSETPTVTLSLGLEGGPLLEPIEKAGLASLTAMMMNESSRKSSNEELANRLSLLGSSIDFSAGGRFTTISVSSLKKNLQPTLQILQEKLFEPAFLPEDLERIKQRLLQSLQQQAKQPEVLAGRAVSQLLFGEQNRVSLPDAGTLESIQAITLDDVKGFYNQYYSPAMAKLVVVGDVQPKQLKEQLSFLTQWQGNSYQIPAYHPFPEWQQSRIYLIDKPDAAQSVIRIIKPDLPYDAVGENFRTKLMNFPLGGMFNSRINLNLREDKGYTYGASSGFVGGKTLGWFQVATSVKAPDTLNALNELKQEITQYQQQGMTEAEIASMRSAFTQSDALKYETPWQKAGFLRHLLVYGLERGYVHQQTEIIKTISRQELNALAAKHLDLSQMQIIIVGDKQKLLPQLQSLDTEVVEMNVIL